MTLSGQRDAAALVALVLERCQHVDFRGEVITRPLPRGSGTGVLGEFRPRSHSNTGDNELHYVEPGPERNPQLVLITLCHELGHFWAHYSGRRASNYLGRNNKDPKSPSARYQMWRIDLHGKVTNRLLQSITESHPEWTQRYDVVRAEIAALEPLGDADVRAVLDDERTAWHFGFLLARRLGVPASAFLAEASDALAIYGRKLNRPELVLPIDEAQCVAALGEPQLQQEALGYVQRLAAD